MRRRQLFGLVALSSLMVATPCVIAQPFPHKPLRIIVGYAPGAQSDATARLVGQTLGDILGQPVVIENRAGANGTIGAELAARSPADGYTLLLGGNGNLTLAPALDSRVRYDAARDFVVIGRIARVPWVLAVSSKVPATNFPQFVAHAKQHQGQLTYASAAATTQLAIEVLKSATGIEALHVPYKGTAPALVDVGAGRVDFMLADVSAVVPHVQSGTIRLIASTGNKRTRTAPELPTLIEQGVAGFAWESWQAIVVPSGTPPDIVARLQTALRQVVASTSFREGLERLGFEPIDEPAAESAVFLRQEVERFRILVHKTNLLAER
jgi:tripartite-type tricarboxylate transporter receptor subunit TctC